MAIKMRKTGPKDLAKYEPDFLLGLYRDMLRTRAVDDRIEALYKQAKLVGGCYSSRGQEGCSIGSTAARIDPSSRSTTAETSTLFFFDFIPIPPVYPSPSPTQVTPGAGSAQAAAAGSPAPAHAGGSARR